MKPCPADSFEVGCQALEAQDYVSAINAFEAARREQGDHPKLLFLLGNAYLHGGRAEAALDVLKIASARERNHPAIANSLAQALFDLGRHAEAGNAFRKAARLDPSTPFAQVGLANALAMQGKLGEAETLLKRVVSRFPDAAFGWLNLGNVARDQSRAEEATAHYRRALQCDPSLIEARNNLGSVLHSLLRFEDAEREYRACLHIEPGYALARGNLISALIDRGRFAEAEREGQTLLQLTPGHGHAHALLATAIASQGRLRQALPHFREAARLAPHGAREALSLASALHECGDSEASLRAFGALMEQAHDALLLEQMLTPVLLGAGFLRDGWRLNGARPAYHRVQRHYSHLNIRQSIEGSLANKAISVLGEQGLGDELFFLRFVVQLAARGACVTYCASPKFGAMLERIAGIARVVYSPDALPADGDKVLGFDVPHVLHASESPGSAVRLWDIDWPSPPYAPLPPPSVSIPPLPERMEAMRARLAAVGPPPYLAITWRGGTAPDKQRGGEWKLYKEIPVATLGAALSHWRGTVLALQRLPAAGELAAVQAALGQPLADFTALNEDLEAMLALLALIDEYVGVSNTNMHLRAAAGKTARVLTPCPAEWRWMGTGSSPWFPGFAVYRQNIDGRWEHALAALDTDLRRKQQ